MQTELITKKLSVAVRVGFGPAQTVDNTQVIENSMTTDATEAVNTGYLGTRAAHEKLSLFG